MNWRDFYSSLFYVNVFDVKENAWKIHSSYRYRVKADKVARALEQKGLRAIVTT